VGYTEGMKAERRKTSPSTEIRATYRTARNPVSMLTTLSRVLQALCSATEMKKQIFPNTYGHNIIK
jgi:hypothetical protein